VFEVFIKLTEALKELLKETARQLRGATKRKFMAQTVQKLGKKGIRLAELELGWNRITINKGIKELTTGITCVDNYSGRGRKKSEQHLPNLLSDIKKLVDSQTQTILDFGFWILDFRLNRDLRKAQHWVQLAPSQSKI
jgi:hypothetical protein